MREPLKQAVREHFESFELQESQLQALHHMQHVHRRPRFTWTVGLVSIAALFMVALIFNQVWTQHHEQTIREAIVNEVVANHLKGEPVKHAAADLVALRTTLDRLNFHLSQPTQAMSQHLALLGGGYCSIQDHMAAQLKYVQPETRSKATLYQVALPEDWQFLAKETTRTKRNGLLVSLWVEKDVLFALASQ